MLHQFVLDGIEGHYGIGNDPKHARKGKGKGKVKRSPPLRCRQINGGGGPSGSIFQVPVWEDALSYQSALAEQSQSILIGTMLAVIPYTIHGLYLVHHLRPDPASSYIG